ncbi:MAG: SRPBCC domain-containing protein [Proteobacteria bacterium]|nr:SRPBCC domain-containing protein [Pseudomonadota bacterium]
MASKPSLTLKRRLKAPPQKVYEAWTQPAQMIRWWGGSDEGSRTAKADLRVGGRFHVGFKGMDGEQHDVSGTYKEVSPYTRLVFSWAWRTTPERESQVTLDIEPDPDGSLLTLTHEQFYDQKACDDHKVGWGFGLDQLEKLFA